MVSVTKARTLLVDAVILFVSSFRKIPSANTFSVLDSFSRVQPTHWLRRVWIVPREYPRYQNVRFARLAFALKSYSPFRYQTVRPKHRTLTANRLRWNVLPCMAPFWAGLSRNQLAGAHHTDALSVAFAWLDGIRVVRIFHRRESGQPI